LGEKIQVDDSLLRDSLHNAKKEVPSRIAEAPQGAPTQERKSRGEMLAESLIAIIIKYPFLISYAERHLSLDQIEGEDNKGIYKNLIIYYNKVISSTESSGEVQINYFGLKDWFANQDNNQLEKSASPQDHSSYTDQLKLLDQLVILGDRDFYDLGSDDAKKEIVKIILYIKDIYFSARKGELEKLIIQAEKDKDEELVKGLIEELKILTDESSQLRN
jgi:hypothetical protein